MHDRAMQALHALALAPIAETLADRNSYGFREGRCCIDALEQCFRYLQSEQLERRGIFEDAFQCANREPPCQFFSFCVCECGVLGNEIKYLQSNLTVALSFLRASYGHGVPREARGNHI